MLAIGMLAPKGQFDLPSTDSRCGTCAMDWDNDEEPRAI
jgi:hypothetical protein